MEKYAAAYMNRTRKYVAFDEPMFYNLKNSMILTYLISMIKGIVY